MQRRQVLLKKEKQERGCPIKRAVVDSLYRVEKRLLSDEQLLMIADDLHLFSRSGDNFGFGGPKEVILFEENNGWVSVPRHYGRQNFIAEHLDDKTTIGEEAKFNFTGEYRDGQEEVVHKMQDAISDGGGIVIAPTGAGKTVMSIAFLSSLGRKAIVIVNREFLLDQWKNDTQGFKKFTDLDDDDIGIVQGDVCNYKGKKVVIAMLQTLLSKRFQDDFYKSFGCVLVDECDRISAPKWNQVVKQFPGRWRYGVTATEERADNLSDVFKWHIGDVIIRVKKWDVKPDVFILERECPLDTWKYFKRDGTWKLAALITAISKIEERTYAICKEIVKAFKAERKILVLSDRIDQLKKIHSFCSTLFPLAGLDFSEVTFFIGGMSSEDRKKALKKTILLGTYGMCQRALDLDILDCLIMATPKAGGVAQGVGRILRKAEGKKTPIVIDIADRIQLFWSFAGSREKKYRENKWVIKRSKMEVDDD